MCAWEHQRTRQVAQVIQAIRVIARIEGLALLRRAAGLDLRLDVGQLLPADQFSLCIYIYIYREREGERDKEREREIVYHYHYYYFHYYHYYHYYYY